MRYAPRAMRFLNHLAPFAFYLAPCGFCRFAMLYALCAVLFSHRLAPYGPTRCKLNDLILGWNPRTQEPLNPFLFRRRDMKKLTFYLAIVGLGVVFFFPSIVYPRDEKEILSEKQAQTEIKADNNQYVIGPEDVLYIHTWKEEALSRAVPVRMDGKISMPLIDEIQAAGLSPLQLKEVLIEKFRRFIDNPNISVIVMEANSYKVYVSGLVRAPGVYRIRNEAETTLLQIIPMAGGLLNVDQKKILIIRKENGKEKRITVNYKKIIQGQEPISDCVLKPGDTVIVPDSITLEPTNP
jgi:polysaccharide export outer membrane protein